MPVREAVSRRKAKAASEAQVSLDGVRVVKVGTNIGVTLNMGNYESLRLDCSMEAEITGPEHIDKARAHLAQLCAEQLQRDYDNGDWPLVTT